MVVMKMLSTAVAAGVIGALAAPVAADAAIQELGQFDATIKGSCPSKPCYAFSRTTGYQAKVGDKRAPLEAPADGRIVAFTVALGKPGTKQTAFFREKLGGAPSLQLTILNAPKKLRSRAVAQSTAFDPTPWFGTTAQFALDRSLPVKKGQLVGITSTTWAPILAVNQPNTTSWRASRGKGSCGDVSQQTAQTQPNQLARYYCLYKGVRLAYSATFIPDPPKAKTSR